MNRIKIWMTAATMTLAMTAGVLPARAATSFDFLFSIDSVNNDREYFLNLAVDKYGYRRADLEPVLPRLSYVEVELPVVLFLSRQSHRSADYIVGLRARGLSWSAVFGRVGVPMDVLFVGIDQDPGPPYGKAWGHWRRNRRGVRLSDRDVCRLVEVQVGSRLSGTRPYDLARGERGDVVGYVAERKGRRYQDRKHGRGQHRDHDHDHHHDHPGH